jgi:hypothetical protein
MPRLRPTKEERAANNRVKKFNNAAIAEGKVKAEIKRLAALSAVAYETERKAIADKLNLRARKLDEFVGVERARLFQERLEAEAKAAKEKQAAEPERDVEAELREVAGDLIGGENILKRFADTIGAVLVGDTDNAKILYLALMSRVFDRPDRPVSIAIKGVSAGGKSYTVERVLEFFPPESFFELTGASEKALPYMEEEFKRRFIVVYEAAGINTDTASMHIRTLLSEGKLIYYTNESTPDGIVPRKIEKEGPTGLITTTTLPSLHPENETRLLSLGVVDTPDQTKAVMQSLARGDGGTVIDYAPWHAHQRLLAAGECRVVIPYAMALADLIPPVAVRLRRDFQTLQCLIRAHALVHRETRERNAAGRIVATLDDYQAVRALVLKLFSESIEATVSKAVRETVQAVANLLKSKNKESVSQAELVEHLKLDKSTVSYRVGKSIDRGYLQNLETKPKVAAKLVLGDRLPEEKEILPSVAEVMAELLRHDPPPTPRSPSPGTHSNSPTAPVSDGKDNENPLKRGLGLDSKLQQPQQNGFPTSNSREASNSASTNSQGIDSIGVSGTCWSVGSDSVEGSGGIPLNVFGQQADAGALFGDGPPRRSPACAYCHRGEEEGILILSVGGSKVHMDCEEFWLRSLTERNYSAGLTGGSTTVGGVQ